MPDIIDRLGRDVIVVDGAMGTMLQRAGMPPEQCPEQLNVINPEMVRQIHHDYVLAGAHVVSSNTFGGTRLKLAEYGLGDRVEELNRAGVRVARESGAQHVFGDVGPTGLVLEPLGRATFDEVFALFAEQVRALASAKPDAIALETFTDIAEARCALLAARSVTDLPVFASLTYGAGGRTPLSGTTPETAAIILEACGASAIGMNCGIGPEQMLPLVRRLAAATSLPVFAQPNAGLPALVDGRTVFPGTPDEMGAFAAAAVDAGATMVGSCCGSSPSFTGAIMDFTRGRTIGSRPPKPAGVALASPRADVHVGAGLPLAIIGERINPTGKKALADSLRAGSVSIVRTLAEEQGRAGADLLDVNVGAAGVDAAAILPKAATALVGMTDLPLVLDSTDPAAIEAALRVYPGRALVNSVNGGADSMRAILPLARRYGAAVVVLCLDDAGIPPDAGGRLAVAQRVRDAAHEAGLTDDDLVVDCLVMTAATDARAATETLSAVRTVAGEWGLATVLGVSNVSHGLPGRPQLNVAFLDIARAGGLSAAIYNPADVDLHPDDATRAAAEDVLLGRDVRAARWIERVTPPVSESAGAAGGASGGGVAQAAAPAGASAAARLAAAVERGDAEGAPPLADEVIASGYPAERVIGEVLTPAIQRLGDAFGRGEVFLPQMMVAADAMKAAVERVKTHLPEGGGAGAGRVVFATVKGDVHSIGKDICVSLLESQSFAVTDLGVDVPVASVLDAAREADIVCLSALMTTTLPAMEATVSAVREHAGLPVLVGGAVVTGDWASAIGAGYAADAPGCVDAVRAAIAAKRG
jgi:5-methyltetrahydrofolate--homocysteine methyltransferase